MKAGLILRCASWHSLDLGRAVGDASRRGRQKNHGAMEKTVDGRSRGSNVGKILTGLNWEWLWERTGSKIWFWGLSMQESEVGCIWVAKVMSVDGWESDYFNHISLCAFFGSRELQKLTQWIHDQMGEANPFTSQKKKKKILQLYSSGRMTPPKSLKMKTSNKYSKS